MAPLMGDGDDEIRYYPIPPGTDFFGKFRKPAVTATAAASSTSASSSDNVTVEGQSNAVNDTTNVIWQPVTDYRAVIAKMFNSKPMPK